MRPPPSSSAPPSSTFDSPEKVDFTSHYETLPIESVDEVLDFPSSRNSLAIFSQCQVFMISLTISLTVFLTSASLGSAVTVERIFSGGCDTISLRRASLKPETIRILMLVKQKLHLAHNAAQQALGDT